MCPASTRLPWSIGHSREPERRAAGSDAGLISDLSRHAESSPREKRQLRPPRESSARTDRDGGPETTDHTWRRTSQMSTKPLALVLMLTGTPAVAWASPADEFTAKLNGFHTDPCNGVVASELQSRNIDAGEVRSLTYDWKLNSWKSAWIH